MAEHNLSGSKAEDAAADYLKKNGYKILDQNWQTKWCEIDIVAKKHGRVYFVEVKYRASPTYGGGYDYITPKKQKQMDLAGRSWSEINGWDGEQVLSAVEVTGEDYAVSFLEEI